MQDPIDSDFDDKSLAIIDEVGSDIVELDDDVETLMARIPLLAGSNKKAAYLAYRSTGFTITKACDLAGIHISTVHEWRKRDAVFKRFEEEELGRLQETVGVDVLKFEFMRNLRMLLHSDAGVIAKGINNLETLTEREYELFKQLRRFYTANDLLSIEKAAHPEKHRDGPVRITLSWGNRSNTVELDTDLVGDFHELPAGTDEEGEDLP